MLIATINILQFTCSLYRSINDSPPCDYKYEQGRVKMCQTFVHLI